MYVSSVEGHVVSRYGSGKAAGRRDSFIGARRLDGGGYEWDTEVIVALTHAEIARYRGEYRRAIKNGALKERTVADYEARRKQQKDDAKATQEKQQKEAAAAAKAQAAGGSS